MQNSKAQVGDQVRQGQVLATFAAERTGRRGLARAALSEASANAAEARVNADRPCGAKLRRFECAAVQQYLTAGGRAGPPEASARRNWTRIAALEKHRGPCA